MPKDRKDEDGLPAPGKGARREPEMNEDFPSRGNRADRLSQLADLGGDEMGGGEDEQAAQLVLGAAEQLNQAAQLQPQLQPIVERVMAVLRSGMQEMMGGGGGEEGAMGGAPPEKPPRKQRKRMRPPGSEEGGEEESQGMMGMF